MAHRAKKKQSALLGRLLFCVSLDSVAYIIFTV